MFAVTAVFAQDAATTTLPSDPTALAEAAVAELIAAPEVTAADLEVGNTSWFSRAWLNTKIFFTADALKKSELELKKANTTLILAQSKAAVNPSDPKLQEFLQKRLVQKEQILARINERLGTFRQNHPDSAELKKFLDKYLDQQFKQEQLLEKLQSKVPAAVAEKIKERREEHLKKIGEVMAKLQNKEEFKKRVQTMLENKGENIENRLRKLEVLNKIEEISPELQAKVEELKAEGKEVWADVKEAQAEIQKNRAELKKTIQTELQNNKEAIKNDPTVRQEIINNLKEQTQDIRTENQQIRSKTKTELKNFLQEAKPQAKDIRNTIRETIKAKKAADEPAEETNQ